MSVSGFLLHLKDFYIMSLRLNQIYLCVPSNPDNATFEFILNDLPTGTQSKIKSTFN